MQEKLYLACSLLEKSICVAAVFRKPRYVLLLQYVQVLCCWHKFGNLIVAQMDCIYFVAFVALLWYGGMVEIFKDAKNKVCEQCIRFYSFV